MSEKLPRIHYRLGKQIKILPEWAYFFLRLGYQLANSSDTTNRFIIGVAIPARAFATSFTATGVVLARAACSMSPDDASTYDHRDLKLGTPVHVRINGRKYRGTVEKFEENFGETYIFIRTTKLGHLRGGPLAIWGPKITIADGEVNLPKYQQTGHSMEKPSKFLECCIGRKLAKKYVLNSSFDVLIIGKKSVIQHEVCDTLFVTNDTDGAVVEDFLQKILRLRQFSGANRTYRSQIVSSSSANPQKKLQGHRDPSIVIFDGAVAYIKHGHEWPTSQQVVLLDRTERQFWDARTLLNQNYAYRSEETFKFPISIPRGIEMMVYKERF